jgi:hypothetical protein
VVPGGSTTHGLAACGTRRFDHEATLMPAPAAAIPFRMAAWIAAHLYTRWRPWLAIDITPL